MTYYAGYYATDYKDGEVETKLKRKSLLLMIVAFTGAYLNEIVEWYYYEQANKTK